MELGIRVGARVSVASGDGQSEMGQGVLTGFVTVYGVQTSTGALISLVDCERRPSEAELAAMGGGEIIELEDNPKIEMDDGRIVYGCQVWWNPIPTLVDYNKAIAGLMLEFYQLWQKEAPPSGVTFRQYIMAICDMIEGESAEEVRAKLKNGDVL